jgi:hypothetical protein
MPHPTVARCLANTIECARKSAEADERLAALGAEDMERLAKSRETIAHSEHLLARLNLEWK